MVLPTDPEPPDPRFLTAAQLKLYDVAGNVGFGHTDPRFLTAAQLKLPLRSACPAALCRSIRGF